MKTTDRIIDHVAQNPGVRYADLCEAVGISSHAGHVTYVRKSGRIFSAGPRRLQRYYPTLEQAAAADPVLRAEAKAAERARIERHWQENNRRRKAASRLLGRSVNTRPTQAVQGDPFTSEFVVAGRRYVVAAGRTTEPPPRVVNPAESRPWAAAAVGAR